MKLVWIVVAVVALLVVSLYEMAIFVILYVAIIQSKVGYLIVIAIIVLYFLISRKRGEILLGALQL